MASTWVHPVFLVGPILLIFLVFCVVLLCAFMFWVSCGDGRYNFVIQMIFGPSLPPLACRRVHVLFMLFPCFAYSDVQHILCCAFAYMPTLERLKVVRGLFFQKDAKCCILLQSCRIHKMQIYLPFRNEMKLISPCCLNEIGCHNVNEPSFFLEFRTYSFRHWSVDV